MASSLSERDFKTPGDGLLTFDSITGREWLDPVATHARSRYNFYVDHPTYTDGPTSVAGFTYATKRDVQDLILHGGIDPSKGHLFEPVAIAGINILNVSYLFDSIITTPPSTLEAVDAFFNLLNVNEPYWNGPVTGLYGSTVDGYLVAVVNKLDENNIPYEAAIGYSSWQESEYWASLPNPLRPFLYRGGDPQILDYNAPTNISLSGSRIVENTEGQHVGALRVSDPDADDNHTLALSGIDAGQFEISNDVHPTETFLKLRSGVSADYESKSSYSVTVTATDSDGLSKSQAFTIVVIDVVEHKNTAPTAINLSNSNITENAVGAVVGTLSVADPDTDDTHTLTLSGYHAGLFEVSNNQLKLRSGVSADYEAQSSYSVTVTATDSGGLSKSQPFTINVTDAYEAPKNTAPTAITLSNNSIAENVPLAIVGTLNVTDPDAKDSHTLTLSGQDADSFYISSSSYTGHSLKWKSSTGADYETKSSYNITATATDSGGLSKSQSFTVNVTDVVENKAPTAINLSNVSIAENDAGAVVGFLSVTDPNTDDTHTLTFSGYSDGFFVIQSNELLRFAHWYSADYETQSSYSVKVTATDSGGLRKSQRFTIKVTDVDETTSTDNGDNSTYSGKSNDSGDTTTPSTQKTLYGSAGNDILDGFSGYDIIDGKGGLDTAKYSVASTEVSFSENDAGQLAVMNTPNSSLYTGKEADIIESDTLISMERIQFSDKNYALDLDGNAGVAAKAVITCFGKDSLSSYLSAGLTIADGGSTLDEICELVASMGYIESIKGISTNSSFVDFIFENVVGRLPNFLESSRYTQFLDDGAYTKGRLLTLAAGTELVGKQLTESAVDLIGVPGSADGEILALQYDLGLG
jgi:hypothetical protein